jgi:hypothetical protein
METDWIRYVPFNDITVNLIIVIGGYLVLTRKLIWHKDHERALQEKEEWKQLALRLLGTTEKLTRQTEVVSTVLSHSIDGDGDEHESVP